MLTRPAILRACAAAALAVLLTGCADNITFSHDFQKEGIRLYNQRQYADAAGAFREAVRQNPRLYEAHYYLGQSYDELGQHQQALQAYKAGLDVMHTTLIGKNDLPFRQKLIDALAKDIAGSADQDHELQTLADRAKSGRGSPEDYLLQGRIYREIGDADSAIAAYTTGAATHPKDFPMQKEAGLYFEQLGLTDRALPALRRAQAIDASDDQVNGALLRLGALPK
jgi:tetratricopeptide (TPR) repeat protein